MQNDERADGILLSALVQFPSEYSFSVVGSPGKDKQQFVGNNRLMLMFGAKDFQLRQWTVTDPQGYDTTVAVYNLDTKTKPNPDLFKINYDNPDLQNTR